MRRVFFSFHYARDVWRVSKVRNSWLIRPENQATPFLDAVAWEQVKRQGRENIERWIQNQLNGTSVTVVLIGAQTSLREWVQYEIVESHNRRNGLLGIYIHNIQNQFRSTDAKGANPFDGFYITNSDQTQTYLSSIYPTYDWVIDNGRQNIGTWIEAAAIRAGR